MNIMIADDEHIIRTGIMALVDNIGCGFEVNTFACDGEEALDVASAKRPDIIIADINMPKKNGLEFISALKNIPEYEPEIIVLTGFREFDFIQKSIELGVIAFLLKPVKRDTLEEALNKCRDSILRKRKIANIVSNFHAELPAFKNSFLLNLLTGTTLTDEEIAFQFERFEIKPLKLFATVCIKSNGLNHSILINEFPENKQFNFCFCTVNSSETCILVFSDAPDTTRLYSILKKLSDAVTAKTHAALQIGISSFYSGADYYSTAYYESLETASAYSSEAYIRFYAAAAASVNMKKEIQDAFNIIARDYSKTVTVDNVAEELKISSSHLMHSFKQETGKTFNSYLTEYRMTIAFEMLRSKKYRIYEIANQLGYKSTKHFSRLFKTITGHSPSKYTHEDN